MECSKGFCKKFCLKLAASLAEFKTTSAVPDGLPNDKSCCFFKIWPFANLMTPQKAFRMQFLGYHDSRKRQPICFFSFISCHLPFTPTPLLPLLRLAAGLVLIPGETSLWRGWYFSEIRFSFLIPITGGGRDNYYSLPQTTIRIV